MANLDIVGVVERTAVSGNELVRGWGARCQRGGAEPRGTFKAVGAELGIALAAAGAEQAVALSADEAVNAQALDDLLARLFAGAAGHS